MIIIATKKEPVVAPRPKAVGKTRTPKQVAAQWGMDPFKGGKAIRRHLRRLYETTHEGWALTDAMVKNLAKDMKVDPVTGKKLA